MRPSSRHPPRANSPFGRVFRPSEVRRRLREVTAGEIRAVAGDFFRPERLNLALVSPLNTTNRLAKLLR
jgi:hypothetical protein